MRTPAGKECRFFYGDYYRGRNHEECDLLKHAIPPLPWDRSLCQTCPVPDILLANACNYLEFEPSLERPFPFIQKKVKVKAICRQTGREEFDPYVGCSQCHPLPFVLPGDVDESDTSD
jgi:hypothetical protein